MKHVQEMTNWT